MTTLIATLARIGPYRDHMDRWDNGTTWWMVVMMSIFAIAVLAAIVWGIVLVSRSGRGHTGAPPAATPSGPSPRDILDRRYANGEIDTADYEERKSKLG